MSHGLGMLGRALAAFQLPKGARGPRGEFSPARRPQARAKGQVRLELRQRGVER